MSSDKLGCPVFGVSELRDNVSTLAMLKCLSSVEDGIGGVQHGVCQSEQRRNSARRRAKSSSSQRTF